MTLDKTRLAEACPTDLYRIPRTLSKLGRLPRSGEEPRRSRRMVY